MTDSSLLKWLKVTKYCVLFLIYLSFYTVLIKLLEFCEESFIWRLHISVIIESIVRLKVTFETLNRLYNLCLSSLEEILSKFLWWNWTILNSLWLPWKRFTVGFKESYLEPKGFYCVFASWKSIIFLYFQEYGIKNRQSFRILFILNITLSVRRVLQDYLLYKTYILFYIFRLVVILIYSVNPTGHDFLLLLPHIFLTLLI